MSLMSHIRVFVLDTGPGKHQSAALRLGAMPLQIYEMGLSLLLMWAIQYKTHTKHAPQCGSSTLYKQQCFAFLPVAVMEAHYSCSAAASRPQNQEASNLNARVLLADAHFAFLHTGNFSVDATSAIQAEVEKSERRWQEAPVLINCCAKTASFRSPMVMSDLIFWNVLKPE